jgi:hypothetical protein
MKFVNLTPHAITICGFTGEYTMIPPSGSVCRVASNPGTISHPFGFPCYVASPTVYGEVEGLPAPQDGVAYLVSGMVLSALQAGPIRRDVFAPGTGPNDGAIRNDKGHIAAVTRLIAAF